MRHVQLRAFHYVATRGGFSRAADALHITQPAVSDQVRKLELEYDIRLFDRHNRQVSLTADGQALLDITHSLFEVEQQALEFLSESRAIRLGNLRIMADSAHHMMQPLVRFRQQFPDVFISVRSGNSQQVIEALNRYEADIGVLGNLPDSRSFDIVKLDSSPIIAFAPLDSPYANHGSVSLQDLSSWPLVLREQGSRTRAKLEEHAKKSGVSLSIRIEAEGREAVRQIVSHGGGVGIVSEAEFESGENLSKIRIREAQLTMEEVIVCLAERGDNTLINGFMTQARLA